MAPTEEAWKSLQAMAGKVDQQSKGRKLPKQIPYPALPAGQRNAARRQWLSLLWSIDSATQHGTHALKGLAVALSRIIVADELDDFIFHAEEHHKPPRKPEDLLWDKRLPLDSVGRTMEDLPRKLPRTLTVEMSETAVFPYPWDRRRFLGALQNLGPGRAWGPWKQVRNNHFGVAWKPWPIVWVSQGNHSTLAALIRGGGRFRCYEALDFTPVLEAVRTDGVVWKRADDGTELGPVRSLPMAGIFLIGQRLAGIDSPAPA